MLPLFDGDDSRKRKINLGGASTAVSYEAVLKQAKADRNERRHAQQRQEAAATLQAFWRSHVERQKVKDRIRERFDENITGLDAMRCLVLLKTDDERLGLWSEAVVNGGECVYSINTGFRYFLLTSSLDFTSALVGIINRYILSELAGVNSSAIGIALARCCTAAPVRFRDSFAGRFLFNSY